MEHPTFYRTVKLDGLSIFYREAGPKDAPVLLLLHGLPSSSRMFEPLFARLSGEYHLIAPDYPGFGHSDWPDPKNFAYTFDHYAEILESFHRSARAFALYACTCRIMAARWAFAWRLRIRNASRRSSFKMPWRTTKAWARIGILAALSGPIAPPMKAPCARISCRWPPRARATSAAIPTSSATTRTSGPTNSIFSISPARPRSKAISSTITAPTSTPTPNGKPGCAQTQPRLLVIWGKYELSFDRSEPEAYRRDVPNAEIHIVDGGHFALDTAADAIAQLVRAFLNKP